MYPWGLFGFSSTQATREDIACLRKCDHGSENFSVLYTGSMLRREREGQQRDGKSLFLKNQELYQLNMEKQKIRSSFYVFRYIKVDFTF